VGGCCPGVLRGHRPQLFGVGAIVVPLTAFKFRQHWMLKIGRVEYLIEPATLGMIQMESYKSPKVEEPAIWRS
jgi:hypothetical protein